MHGRETFFCFIFKKKKNTPAGQLTENAPLKTNSGYPFFILKSISLPFVLSFALSVALIALLLILQQKEEPTPMFLSEPQQPLYLTPKNKKVFLRLGRGGKITKKDLLYPRRGTGDPLEINKEETLATFRESVIKGRDIKGDLRKSGQKEYLQLLLEELWLEAEAERRKIYLPIEETRSFAGGVFAGSNQSIISRRLRGIFLASALYSASGNNINSVKRNLRDWQKETYCNPKYRGLCP